jgi:hypothetical protein
LSSSASCGFLKRADLRGDRVSVVRSEKPKAEAEDSLGNPEEEERPQLKAATEQRLVKTAALLYVL